jgi:hypothetical protein
MSRSDEPYYPINSFIGITIEEKIILEFVKITRITHPNYTIEAILEYAIKDANVFIKQIINTN